MNEVGELMKTTERRWNDITSLYIISLVYPANSFKARLFHSGDWQYPVEFVLWASLMLYLLSGVRLARRPSQHASSKEFRRLQLRSGVLVAMPMAAYASFFEYSGHEANLFGLCVVAIATCLTFLIGAVSLKNPPMIQSTYSPSPNGSDMLVGPN